MIIQKTMKKNIYIYMCDNYLIKICSYAKYVK